MALSILSTDAHKASITLPAAGSTGSLTYTVTVPAGAALVVMSFAAAMISGAPVFLTSSVIGGQPYAGGVATLDAGPHASAGIIGYANVPSGSVTVQVDFQDATGVGGTAWVDVILYFVSGADPAIDLGKCVSSSSGSLNVPSVSGDLVFDAVHSFGTGAPGSAGAGQTSDLAELIAASYGNFGASHAPASGASTTMSWGAGLSGNITHAGMAVSPAKAGGFLMFF